jgi:hypothetical protein
MKMSLQRNIEVTKDMPQNLFSKDSLERSLFIKPQELSSLNTIVSVCNQISCESINYVDIACENL